MSTQLIYEAVAAAIQKALGMVPTGLSHLDVGAGRGGLILHLQHCFGVDSQACDYHVDRFPLADVAILKVDLNREPLPFTDHQFDLVTSSEVIEHLENYHHLLGEARRVLKPGGLLVLTTPNVLNMKSRVRNLIAGFDNLFGPLPIKGEEMYSSNSHINPIGCFHLIHALLENDFLKPTVSIDKHQRSSISCLAAMWPALILWPLFLRREKRRGTLTPENLAYVRLQNSWPILTGRTLVISAISSGLNPILFI